MLVEQEEHLSFKHSENLIPENPFGKTDLPLQSET